MPLVSPARLAALALALAALLAASLTAALASAPRADAAANDALTTKVLGELQTFTGWLNANRAKGSVTEFGWPSEDADKWGALAEKWYAIADANGLWTTQFTTGPYGMYGQAPYHMLTYRRIPGPDGGSTLGLAGPQAAVLEAHRSTSRYRRGVVVSGGDWTLLDANPNGSFSNTNPGTYGGEWGSGGWRYESKDSYRYLRSRGVDTVRINFRWERLQPTLFGPLDDGELNRLKATISAAESAGLGVILTLHNYGEYYLSPYGRVTVGEQRLPIDALADVWVKISRVFSRDSKLVAYSLMNEPHDLNAHVLDDGGHDVTGSKLWELASQKTLTAIRRAGDSKLILVPGYNWSHLDTWLRDHPVGWINDPARNFRYDAHQYWDAGGSGSYVRSYADENALAGG